MKSTFRPRLLNGHTGDPALLLSLRWQGRALLVDLGRIDRTPAPLLLPIEAVFVSHTHMDHFMGFDQLLRLLLARDATLRLYGPTGLADCVEGKLKGYTWNLTDEYAFTIDVTDSDELLVVTPGQKIAYVVDTLFSPANVARVTRLARGADVFFCEAPFLEEDLEQATRRYHLTAAQAGALARAAAVRRLQVFHFSPRYEGRYGEIIAEAQAEFAGRHVRYGGLERGRAALP